MSSEGTAQPPPPASNDAAPAPAADAPPPAAAEPPKEDTAALSSTANDNAAKLKALRDAQRKQRCEAAALQLSLDRTNAEIKAEREKQAQAPPNDANIKPFAEFITKRANTFEALLRIREAFKYGEGILESELRSASLDTVFDQCETWSKNDYAQNISSTVDELVATGKSMAEQGADVHDCSELRKLVDEITTIYKSHACKWHREMTRRRCRDKLAGDFDADRVKLLTWCRQQVAALANVTEPDHVQEFCASFYNNTAVMESNFLVLMEMSENLLPSAEIEAQLMELAEVWLGLEMQAYEKLRSTLLDLHAKAGIEALARQWPDFADRFDPFLVEAQRILNIPTDEESKAVAAPLKDAAKELQANADPHRLIVAHISDFALREECLKEHYNAIHKAAFSKLTLMTQAFPGLYAYPRKAEYTDRMAELSEWIEAKSRSQAWKDLLARVDRMKRIIEDNENALSSTEERY